VAYQEGFAAGRDEGYQAGQAQGHESGKLAGIEEGQLAGFETAQTQADVAQAQALADQKSEILAGLDDQKILLKEVTDKLQALSDNPQALFEPLKRLALHISEHMVLAELNLSGQAIERLVQRCLDEIDLHGQSQVLIELNPQDKSRLQEMAGDVMSQMQIQAVSTLQPGSVRVLVNDTQIEDLVQNRMQTHSDVLGLFVLGCQTHADVHGQARAQLHGAGRNGATCGQQRLSAAVRQFLFAKTRRKVSPAHG